MKTLFKRVIGLVLVLGMGFSGVYGQQNSLDGMMKRADSLYQNFHEEQALELYNQILEKQPQNHTALWRASFLYSRIGNRFKDENRKRDYFNSGIELAERAIQVDSTDTWSNFVMAVAMGRKALIAGARERVAASRAIRHFAKQAIRYDSTNAGPWHVMGRWHYKIANLSFVERLAANALFGGVPGPASNEEALRHIKKAIELDPSYILYYFDLAEIYRDLGKEQEAVNMCRQALEIPNLTPDDPELKVKCKNLIHDLR